jgi:hypothetical protein
MKRFAFMLVLAGALLVPSAALAGGVVVKVQRATHLIAVTRGKSQVALVHTAAASRLTAGERVAFKARRLHNGTFAGTKVRVVGHAREVRFRGLLLAKTHARFVVSAGGAIITVARHGRSTASTSDDGPAPGSEVTVNATVGDSGDLEDDDVTVTSPSAPGGKIEGTLTLATDTITVSSEDMTLVLKLPTGFDLSAFTNGEEVLAVFVQQTDGTLTLSALSGDRVPPRPTTRATTTRATRAARATRPAPATRRAQTTRATRTTRATTTIRATRAARATRPAPATRQAPATRVVVATRAETTTAEAMTSDPPGSAVL